MPQDDPNSVNLLSQILTNPVGTGTLAPEARNADPGFVPGQMLWGQMVHPGLAQAAQSAQSNALGWAGTFGGVGAKTANLDALQWAHQLEGQGKSSTDIWHATGWNRGADGQWRFEIPDTGARMGGLGAKPNMYNPDMLAVGSPPLDFKNPSASYKLSDVLQHPELFKAYPELANMPVRPMPFEKVLGGVKGAFYPSKGEMYLARAKPPEMLSTTLHEIQHGIQTNEGFGQGGNPGQFISPADKTFIQDTAEHQKELQAQVKDLGLTWYDAVSAAGRPLNKFSPASTQEAFPKLQNAGLLDSLKEYLDKETLVDHINSKAFRQYKAVPGEVEARNVQTRLGNSPYTNATTPPEATEDVSVPRRVPTDALADSQNRRDLLEMRLNGWEPGQHQPGMLQFNPPSGLAASVDSPGRQWKLDPRSMRSRGENTTEHAFDVLAPDGSKPAEIVVNKTGPELHVTWAGAPNGPKLTNQLGSAALLQLKNQLQNHFPDARLISGNRIGGAGPGRDAAVLLKGPSQ